MSTESVNIEMLFFCISKKNSILVFWVFFFQIKFGFKIIKIILKCIYLETPKKNKKKKTIIKSSSLRIKPRLPIVEKCYRC